MGQPTSGMAYTVKLGGTDTSFQVFVPESAQSDVGAVQAIINTKAQAIAATLGLTGP